MRDVFVDAFYYIALLNPADQFHLVALDAAKIIEQPMVTTRWVLLEVANAFSMPVARERASRLLRQIEADVNTHVVSEETAWYHRGLALYGSRPDKSWSLTDCISFEIMREKRIMDALTGDHHFVQAGCRALLL